MAKFWSGDGIFRAFSFECPIDDIAIFKVDGERYGVTGARQRDDVYSCLVHAWDAQAIQTADVVEAITRLGAKRL